METSVHNELGAAAVPAMPPAPLHEERPGRQMSLRTFIDILLERGELKRIGDLVDWKIEIGDIARRHQQPLLFENIKGYSGMRLFANGLSNPSSIALALGFQPEQPWEKILLEARRRAAAPVQPVMVSSGPVLENVMEGPDVNLYELPVPQWNRCDAGRYIGTWHANVTRDPETGRRNLGVYRMQLLGRNQTTVSTSSASHLGRHFAKAERSGQPLEMAVVIGAPEPVVMAAGAGYPSGGDEYELAGGLSGTGVPLVRCRTVNLEVPAEAEIVLQGLIRPGVRVHDGPYFDYAGTPTENPNAYLFDVTCVTFRNHPIFRGAAVGHRAAEDQQLFSLLSELELFDFHDSRPRHQIQSGLIKKRLFRTFQLVGRTNMPPFLRSMLKRASHQDSFRRI